MTTNDQQALVAIRLLEAAAAPDAAPHLAVDAHRAVEALFASHHARIHRVCRRIVRDPERAAELTQDVFVVAWRRLGEWQPDAPFFSWLYSIAKLTCMNALRKKRDLLEDDGFLDDVDQGPGAVTQLRRHERLALLEQASQAVLDDLEREVLHLRYHQGLGQQAITDLLKLPGKSGARGVLVRSRRKLQRELRRRAEALDMDSSYFAMTR